MSENADGGSPPGLGPRLKGPRRGRRWSLDVISPKLHLWKRSRSIGDPDHLSHLSHLSSLSHLASGHLLNVPQTIREESHSLGISFPWKRAQSQTEKEVYAVLDLCDGQTLVITGEDEVELKSLMGAAMMQEGVSSYRVIVSSTKSFLRMSSSTSAFRSRSCENLLQIQPPGSFHLFQSHLEDVESTDEAAEDDRLRVVTEMLQSEQSYCDSLRSLFDNYAEPLRKFSSLEKEDHQILFVGMEPIYSISASLVKKLEQAIEIWDPTSTKIGSFFSSKFWSVYEAYYETCVQAKQFLEVKLKTDKVLKNFCELREQNGLLGLEALLMLPVKRIPEYEKYLTELLQGTPEAHPDYEQLSRAVRKVQDMVKDCDDDLRGADNENKMDAVQDRFPHDDLQLQKAEKTQKPRGLSARRRSAPSAVVFKTLSGSRSRSSSGLWSQSNMGRKDVGDSFQSIRQPSDLNRQYIMEGPVVFARGVQTQDRYLFLFNDLLLVAKQKSSSTFKLKFRVHLCDVWLAACLEEVCEITRPADRSFVLGWPTCNVVATFKDAETKERWRDKLSQHVQEQKLRIEPKEFQLKICVRDADKSASICRVTVTNTTQAREVLQACVQQLSIPETETKDYKLWVWWAKEASPYPLIGHETPFSIKLSHVREVSRSRGEDIDKMTQADLAAALADDEPANLKCDFVLSQKKSPKKHSLEETSHKGQKKPKRDKFINIFKRAAREDKTNNNISTPLGKLFGHPLSSVVENDNLPPKPIVDLLTVLFREGPETVGILRKSPNIKMCREIREKLDQGEAVYSCEGQAPVAGFVIKDFLRNLPDCLLRGELFEEWLKIGMMEDMDSKMAHVRNLLSQLPSCNVQLLKRLLCALHHIQKHSERNKMTASNLSLCIAPSLLWHKKKDDPSLSAPAVTFLIDHCVELFGEDVLHLLGEAQEPRSADSGTDSESMHSVLSMHDGSNGLPRDDSSMDSLDERDMYMEGGECSPRLAKSHLSPTNLSRDSGLTLSDTQLYDEALDAGDNRGKFYPRSAHHFPDKDYERRSRTLDSRSISSSAMISATEERFNPVPPPRRRGERQQDEGDAESGHVGRLDPGGGGGGGSRGRYKRHTLHVSASSSHLLDVFNTTSQLNSSLRVESYQMLPSSHDDGNSLEEEEDEIDHEDYDEYVRKHLGLLRKSPSGAHLMLDNELLPRRLNIGAREELRQSGCPDITPPHSPESKLSQSSRDSVISDSSYGMDTGASRENSIGSSPQTPEEECGGSCPSWFGKPENIGMQVAEPKVLAKTISLPLSSSKYVEPETSSNVSSSGSSHLRSVQNVAYLVSPPASPVRELELASATSFHSNKKDHSYMHTDPSSWPAKSREAKDVTFSLLHQTNTARCSRKSEEKLDVSSLERDSEISQSYSSFPLELHHRSDMPQKYMSRYNRNFAKESPPPRVILQSLHAPRFGKDPPPLRASHDKSLLEQINRSSIGNQGKGSRGLGFDVAKSMEAIKADEYVTVQPKLTFIRREETPSPAHSSISDKELIPYGKDSQASWKDSLASGNDSSSAVRDVQAFTRQIVTTMSSDSNKRPIQPPCYSAALQRKFMLQHDITPDVGISQKEASMRAKIMYEESLQKYLQERYDRKHYGGARSKDDEQGSPTTSSGDTLRAPSPTNSSSSSSSSARNTEEDEYVTLAEHRFCTSFRNSKQMSGDSLLASSPRGRTASPSRQKREETLLQGLSRTSSSAETAKQQASQVQQSETTLKGQLQPPSSNLHRSLSDSSKRTSGHGQCSPRSHSRDRGMADAADVNFQQDSSLVSKKVTESAENRVSVNITRRHLPPVSALNSEQSSGGHLPNFKAGDNQPSRSAVLLPLGSDGETKKLPVDLPVHRSAFTAMAVSSNAVERSTSGNRCALERTGERTGELIADVVDGAGKNGLGRTKASNKTVLDLLTDNNRSGLQRTNNTSRSIVDSYSNPARSLVDSSNKVSRSAVDIVSNVNRKLEDNSYSGTRSSEHSSKPNRSVADSANKSTRSVAESVNKSTRSVADSANKSNKSVVDSANIAKITNVDRSVVKPNETVGMTPNDRTTSSVLPSGGRPPNSSKQNDLPWSVESLRKIYDSDNKPRQSSPDRPVTASAGLKSQPLHCPHPSSSAGRLGPPPPYQDPPPFLRHSDSNRLSMSSSSSSGSSAGRNTPPASDVGKFGPQCAVVDFGSCEDVPSSTRRTRDRSASGGRADLSKRASYTDVSYV